MAINWQAEVEKRKDDLIRDTQAFLRINSVLDESTITANAPFGKGIQKGLEFYLNKGESDGFQVKNLSGYAGHIEYGQGRELIGVLGHVDVVPAGDLAKWQADPYAAEIRDNQIVARGAIDDKGPMMAVYYALKIIKELGLTLNKRVRLILGTDEETLWRCVDHYFAHEEMPTTGFSPDADFPIIHAEKGLRDFSFHYQGPMPDDRDFQVLSFHAGERFNMVPDYAKAVVSINTDKIDLTKEFFLTYCNSALVTGKFTDQDKQVIFEVYGKAAHGSLPHLGVNAGVVLAVFLANYSKNPYFQFIKKYIAGNEQGEKFQINYVDAETGNLTINFGIFHFEDKQEASIAFNMRYPQNSPTDTSLKKITDIAKINLFAISEKSHKEPHYIPADSNLIKVLQRVYTEQTGEEAKLLAIGGATYARSLTQGVAFGPLFPGREDCIHQPNEAIRIDDLVKATAIYAQAIYELAL